MFMNHQNIDITKFEEKVVEKEARAANIIFDTSKPVWTQSFLHKNRLEDATKLFNFGLPKNHLYYDVVVDAKTFPSYYVDYPHNTKIISFHLLASDVINIVGREIYAVPDYVSDVSGFLVGLM